MTGQSRQEERANEDLADATSRWRRYGRAAAGAVCLALVGSAMWDFLVKPGITWFGTGLLSVLTFGSATVRDSVYSSAAVDPTSLPAMLTMQMLILAVVGTFGLWLGRAHGSRRDERDRLQIPSLSKAEALHALATIKKSRGRAEWAMGVYAFVMSVFLIASAAHITASIGVWNSFHANMRICAPHLSSLQRDVLLARFASMSTKLDHDAITVEMQLVAKNSGVKLIPR